MPRRLRELVFMADKNIPSLNSRDLICPCLWQMMFQQHHCKSPADPNHNTIYIFDRDSCPDKPSSSYLICDGDPSTSLLPCSWTLIYSSCTLVKESQKSDMFYLATGLHCRCHGSGMSDSPAFLQGMQKLESMSILLKVSSLHTDPTTTNLVPPQKWCHLD